MSNQGVWMEMCDKDKAWMRAWYMAFNGPLPVITHAILVFKRGSSSTSASSKSPKSKGLVVDVFLSYDVVSLNQTWNQSHIDVSILDLSNIYAMSKLY